MANSKLNTDLPLVSNVNDILVQHYIFNFACNFEEKCFECYAVLFLEPVVDFALLEPGKCKHVDTSADTSNPLKSKNHEVLQCSDAENTSQSFSKFMLILDCHKIEVDQVSEIKSSADKLKYLKCSDLKKFLQNVSSQLHFVVEEWSLKIWTDSETCKLCFPKIIGISYKTVPSGPSLLWVNDQDGNPSVFNYGAWINNRSFFPCQEPPIAMASWEATVSVPNSATVLMSGDEEPYVWSDEGLTTFYYFTRAVLPMSVLCLAAGFWKHHVLSSTHRTGPKCRVFAPSKLVQKAFQVLSEYVPCCLSVSENTLGPYPFPRIDFLLVPPTFGSFGMASPNVIFLSQSLLVGYSSMCSRVAHEIAHGWFGLLIGALDWTEEWLSEGFATFMEDYFHTLAKNMQNCEKKDYLELKAFLRKKNLLHEIENTADELQILRPSQGKVIKEIIDGVDAAILKNGQNPVKGFTQVHYIKGYFLLKYLSDTVGTESFMQFLRAYIKKFKGQLVTCQEFLTMFFDMFPEVQEILTLEKIYENWLHNPGVPVTENWVKINSCMLKKRQKRRKFSFDCVSFVNNLTAEQTILLLENLLNEEKISTQILRHLKESFKFEETDAEVQHRWFEMVVKYKYRPAYAALKDFLTNHLALGVYLYGELIFSGDKVQKAIAEECYTSLRAEMEPNYICTIDQMFLDSAS
ncbi:aminopeptidase O-like isoform X2 [Stegodyphus dumicola]|uniref:aminopeptidase O-like isoform X2 n=1 Tax=Stegodyphus dumicola TaxID=202533 RepID=UPI0015AF191E|nr:aminopeptidase O-like isoform X2 [Stegodyphus dumicola]